MLLCAFGLAPVHVRAAAIGRMMAGLVESTTESAHGGFGRGMKTGAKTHCRGWLVELSWLLLAICDLRFA